MKKKLLSVLNLHHQQSLQSMLCRMDGAATSLLNRSNMLSRMVLERSGDAK